MYDCFIVTAEQCSCISALHTGLGLADVVPGVTCCVVAAGALQAYKQSLALYKEEQAARKAAKATAEQRSKSAANGDAAAASGPQFSSLDSQPIPTGSMLAAKDAIIPLCFGLSMAAWNELEHPFVQIK